LKKPDQNPIDNPISFLKALAMTMIDAHDNYHISKSKGDYDRTIAIPTIIKIKGIEKTIKTTDFDIAPEESQALYRNGVKAAQEFLETWNFAKWKKKYRAKKR
jgi:NTE family protein